MKSGNNILLIEDDKDDQIIFLDALHEISSDYNCAVANNGQEALSFMEKNKSVPLLVFVDLHMPGMDGFQCIASMKQVPRLKDIPIVILSSGIDESSYWKLESVNGKKCFFPKPLDYTFFKNKLNEILNCAFSSPQEFKC